ncbi:hypothetical protein [Nakamurella endophytica]|uniref:hypothetical protein n=1 Tax=Nakamurella endophytica TaxID=1748367 RepID=UPI001665E926|nr:hypothetical protein [Nakamurella endophytica]
MGTRTTSGRTALRALAAACLLAVAAGCAGTVAGTAQPVAGATITSPSATGTAQSATGTGQPATSPGTDSDPTTPDPGTTTGSSTASTGSSGGTDGTDGTDGTTTGSTATSSGQRVDPAEFASRVRKANGALRSMVGSLTVRAAGTSAEGAFSEALAGGRITGIDMNLRLSVSGTDLSMRLLLVSDKIYVSGQELLSRMGITGKRWALASPDSENPVLQQLAGQLDGYLRSAGADQYSVQAAAASEIVDEGPADVKGVRTTRYRMVVDVAKAAAAATGAQKQQLEQSLAAGLRSLPITVYLDERDRVVRAESRTTASGVTASTSFEATSFDTDVTISAPDPATVYTG